MDNEQFRDIPNLDAMEKQLKSVQAYIEMQQLYNGAIREVKTKLDVLDDEFRVRYAHNPIHHMESRLKSLNSIIGKLHKNGWPIGIESALEHLNDIAGIRVICYYIDDIYQIASLLTHQNDIHLVKIRDYIKNPKENGYRSLHLVVRVPVFLSEGPKMVPVEIQIRTIAMDFWASLEHKLRYKTGVEVSDEIRGRLARCAENSAMLDLEMQDIYHALEDPEQAGKRKTVPSIQEIASKLYGRSKQSSSAEPEN